MFGRPLLTALLGVLLIAAVGRPVFAQGYVSASLLGDIARFDQFETAGRETSANGEAIGFALRVGTALGPRWGVELEYARPSWIETESSPDFYPLLTQAELARSSIPPSVLTPLPDVVFPFSYRIHTKQRNTTLSATAWIAQKVSSKFSLSYLGGISFGRTSRDLDITYGPLLGIAPVIIPPRLSSSSITYDVGPIVGIEG